MARGYDPEADTADITDPVSREQARILLEAYNRIWNLKPPRPK